MECHKRKYVLQCEGGLPKSGKGLKERIKRYFIKGASLYLSGMKAEGDYFCAYGADPKLIRTYPFASLHEKDLVGSVISNDDKCTIKKDLDIVYEKVVLYVGRIIPVKGIDILIRACQGMDNNVGVYIVGGVEIEPYSTIAKDLGVTNLHYIPHVQLDTLRKYYLAADVFVLPTRGDTWGLVINEAMTYGLPVITTKNCVAGLQLIEDGVNGFLIESDDYSSLRNKIELILDDNRMRILMGKNNISKMKKYTYENMAKVVYDSLCKDFLFSDEGAI